MYNVGKPNAVLVREHSPVNSCCFALVHEPACRSRRVELVWRNFCSAVSETGILLGTAMGDVNPHWNAHDLTRIRLQPAIYFCLHRGKFAGNTATWQDRTGYARFAVCWPRRLTFSHGNDLTGGEVVEIPWIGRVVARTVRIGKVVKHCVQGEIVVIRKRKAWTSVKEMGGGIVVEVDAALSIIGIKPILVTHVEVVDPVRVGQVAVVTKRRAVGELKIINAVA